MGQTSESFVWPQRYYGHLHHLVLHNSGLAFHWCSFSTVLQEFQPWLKWIIFDAALTLLVGQLVKRVEVVRPLFEAVGWA
jgi:hypothetical protein